MAARVHYPPLAMAAISDVFGATGLHLARTTGVLYEPGGRDGRDAGTDFDEREASVWVRPSRIGDVLVLFHEFAHLYHVTKWRDLSLSVPVVRCEAAAYCAELALAEVTASSRGAVMHRLLYGWDPAARDLAVRAVREAPRGVGVDDLMLGVLEGRYGAR